MTRSLYCDESIWVPVADGLARREWEVHHARDEDMLGESDEVQLAYAADREWILFTFDDDFISLVEGDGLDHTGILYVEQTGLGIGEVVKAVDRYLEERAETIGHEIHYL